METKTIGNKSLFAIEYDLLDVDKDDRYYGYIWFWINGKRIGADYDDTQIDPYLSSSVNFTKEFISYKEDRRFLGSEKIPAEYLFLILYERFYDIPLQTKKDFQDAGTFHSLFSLECVGMESFFDTVMMVLIDEPIANRQRFLWKLYDNKILEEFFIPYGYFEEVAYSYIHQIENDVDDWKKREKQIADEFYN